MSGSHLDDELIAQSCKRLRMSEAERFQAEGPSRYFPYPFRAMRLTVELTLFPWWKPRFRHFHLPEKSRANGKTQWYVRWLFFQVSYSRWL